MDVLAFSIEKELLFILLSSSYWLSLPSAIETPETLASIDADISVDAALNEKSELTRLPRGYGFGRRGYGGYGGYGGRGFGGLGGYGRPFGGGFGGSYSNAYASAGSSSYGFGK
ncbi:protein suex-1-like [Musca domestica]|uniref:Protein suex-1-like n=1 Tax=Musca domestica TaxID=7370 RepID=A0ABM3VCF6_MUSDO|nr:protein suex-1-like [Musca domestica]